MDIVESEMLHIRANWIEVVHGDLKEFSIKEDKIIGEWRHGNEKSVVTQSLKTEKFYRIIYRTGDDMSLQDCNFPNSILIEQVKPITKEITEYVPLDFVT